MNLIVYKGVVRIGLGLAVSAAATCAFTQTWPVVGAGINDKFSLGSDAKATAKKAPAAVAARDDDDNSKATYAFKLGILAPTDSLTKSVLGNGYKLGFDFEGKGDPGRPFVYMDTLFMGASATDGSGDSVSLDALSFGIGVGYKYVFLSGESIRPYAGAGLGLYLNTATLAVETSGGSGTLSASSTNVGFKIFVGATFAKHFIIELGYQQAGSVSDIVLNGTTFDLGFKF